MLHAFAPATGRSFQLTFEPLKALQAFFQSVQLVLKVHPVSPVLSSIVLRHRSAVTWISCSLLASASELGFYLHKSIVKILFVPMPESRCGFCRSSICFIVPSGLFAQSEFQRALTEHHQHAPACVKRKPLDLGTVDQDPCPLSSYCGGLQVMPQKADLREQGFERIRIGRVCLRETRIVEIDRNTRGKSEQAFHLEHLREESIRALNPLVTH